MIRPAIQVERCRTGAWPRKWGLQFRVVMVAPFSKLHSHFQFKKGCPNNVTRLIKACIGELQA